LPPQFHCDLERLTRFLVTLPRGCQHAFEFRHASWFVEPIHAALAAHDVVLCVADRRGEHTPLIVPATWTYLRFHEGQSSGDGYRDDELAAWAERIAAWRDGGTPVFAYFNNDPGGHALVDAQRLRARLAS
jgi:uncharacterized protein YecE (DUF72 family)